MWTFILWLILLVVCWPLALLALVLYPIVWLLLLPFRLLGIAVDGRSSSYIQSCCFPHESFADRRPPDGPKLRAKSQE